MSKVVNMNNKLDEVDTIRIDRKTLWGNPFIMGIDNGRNTVCDLYEEWLNEWIIDQREIVYRVGMRQYSNKWVIDHLDELRGKDLACWCAPERCHGDTLLRLVGGEEVEV